MTGENGTDIRLAEAKTIGTDQVFERVRDAIAEGRAVTLSTDPAPGIKQDGLNDDHVYMVERIYKSLFNVSACVATRQTGRLVKRRAGAVGTLRRAPTGSARCMRRR